MRPEQWLENFKGHFCTITSHKLMVMKLCFRLGLVKQGLLHDLSKYSPVEFLPGVKYYQGHRSPIAAEKEEKGYAAGWLHHKGRNKHHHEYWIDMTSQKEKGFQGMRMPDCYVAEMFCDRVAASKIYYKEKYTDRTALEYYEREKDYIILHPEVRALLEKLLHMLAERGEDVTFAYIRRKVLKK